MWGWQSLRKLNIQTNSIVAHIREFEEWEELKISIELVR